MRTWESDNLKAAWEIIAWPDFDINNIEYLYVKTSDLIDLRDAIRAANAELVTVSRQRDEALAELQKAQALIESWEIFEKTNREEAEASWLETHNQ